MRDDVIFKGNKSGLQLLLNESAEFSTILEQLRSKLDSAAKFFSAGTTIKIPFASRIFNEEQQQQLTELFALYDLQWKESPTPEAKELQNQTLAKPKQQDCSPQTLVITKTLRGGQEVTYSGSVVIIGDVNPGAKILAGGNIIVYGTCRGVAHAGAFGDTNATITANKLLASQLRIADLISRSPDDPGHEPECVETASIKDGVVVIEPASHIKCV